MDPCQVRTTSVQHALATALQDPVTSHRRGQVTALQYVQIMDHQRVQVTVLRTAQATTHRVIQVAGTQARAATLTLYRASDRGSPYQVPCAGPLGGTAMVEAATGAAESLPHLFVGEQTRQFSTTERSIAASGMIAVAL